MALDARYLPRPTVYDPSEDPAGGVDPLGTLPLAERLADVLLPGLTARMWRPRLLTYVALASLIAERIEKSSQVAGGDVWLEARLAFERIFVSALARQLACGDETWKEATASLPGKRLALSAFQNHDTPLGKHNFLKGQASNGPFGVMARLARELDILRTEDDRLGENGRNLLDKWAKESDIPHVSLLADTVEAGANETWLNPLVNATKQHLKGDWRTRQWAWWRDLADKLRLDAAGPGEKKFLRSLMDQNPVRRRFLQLLEQHEVRQAYQNAKQLGVREKERRALEKIRTLRKTISDADRTIRAVSLIITAYEDVASLLEVAFDCLRWGVREAKSPFTISKLPPDLNNKLTKIADELHHKAAKSLDEALENLPSLQVNRLPDDAASDLQQFVQLTKDCNYPETLIQTLLERHKEVQASRGRGLWIEQAGQAGTLSVMPGYGYPNQGPPAVRKRLGHTFRIPNAYRFLHDLGGKGLKPGAGEEEEHE